MTWDWADRASPQPHVCSDAGLLNWTRRMHFPSWPVRDPLAVDNVLSLFYLAGWPESAAPLFVNFLQHLPYLAAALKMASDIAMNWTEQWAHKVAKHQHLNELMCHYRGLAFLHYLHYFYIFLYESMISDLRTPVFRTERIVYLLIGICVCMYEASATHCM